MQRGIWCAAIAAALALSCGEDSGAGFHEVSGVPEVRYYGAVWSFAADDVYVTAEGGRVLHFDGTSWDETQLDTYDTMNAIWAFARDDIWMVGGRTLARYDGSEWTLTDFEVGIGEVTAIWGSAPDDVWVGGSQSTALHWDGDTWQRFRAAGTDNHAIWGSGPDDVYVLGNFEFARFDGSEFTSFELDLFSGESIWGFGPDDVWVADGDAVAHLSNGEWETTEFEFIGGPERIWGLAADDLWGVGQFGSVTHYDGTRWREVTHQTIGSPFLRSYFAIHGSADGDLWILGTEAGEKGVVPLLLRGGTGR